MVEGITLQESFVVWTGGGDRLAAGGAEKGISTPRQAPPPLRKGRLPATRQTGFR
jgi:hypothetical protein